MQAGFADADPKEYVDLQFTWHLPVKKHVTLVALQGLLYKHPEGDSSVIKTAENCVEGTIWSPSVGPYRWAILEFCVPGAVLEHSVSVWVPQKKMLRVYISASSLLTRLF